MRALKLGHIDVEYEWFRMGATHKVPIKGKQMSVMVELVMNLFQTKIS